MTIQFSKTDSGSLCRQARQVMNQRKCLNVAYRPYLPRERYPEKLGGAANFANLCNAAYYGD
jgi:hypothetical protein